MDLGSLVFDWIVISGTSGWSSRAANGHGKEYWCQYVRSKRLDDERRILCGLNNRLWSRYWAMGWLGKWIPKKEDLQHSRPVEELGAIAQNQRERAIRVDRGSPKGVWFNQTVPDETSSVDAAETRASQWSCIYLPLKNQWDACLPKSPREQKGP